MKKTIILAAIAAALAAFIYSDIEKGKEREEAEEYESSLLKIEQDDVNSITLIKWEGDTIVYVRAENDKWRITSPVVTEGDQSAVRSNVSGFVNADIKRRLRTTAAKLKNFGLDPAAMEVIIETGDDRKINLLVGDKAATRGDMFVAFKDSLQVLVTSSNILTLADKSLFDLRDKKIAHYEKDDVKRVEIVSQQYDIVLEKSGDEWIMLKPGGILVDNSRVDSFLNSLKNYSAKSFAQESFSDGAQFGFDKPVLKLNLMLGDELSTKKIVIGKQLEDDDEAHYGYESGRSPVFVVRESNRESMTKEPFYFQDKKIARFDKSEITEIRFSGAYQVTLTKEDTIGWYAFTDSSIKVEDSDMDRLFSHFSALNVRELATYSPEDLIAYGLSSPFLAVSLLREGEQVAGFEVGDGVDSDRYVRSSAYPFIYKSSVSQVDRILEWLKEFFDPEESLPL